MNLELQIHCVKFRLHKIPRDNFMILKNDENLHIFQLVMRKDFAVSHDNYVTQLKAIYNVKRLRGILLYITRWFKYDRDKLWRVYTQSPGHI
jgi:hypothetical protein